MNRVDWADLMLRRLAVTLLFSASILPFADNIWAQDIGLMAQGTSNSNSSGSTLPSVTQTSTVQTTSSDRQANSLRNLTSAVIHADNPSAVAPIAPTSGTSGISRPFSADVPYSQTVNGAVNPNSFLPTDIISDNPVILLPSMRTSGWWDIWATVSTSTNYDSNITRASSDVIGDFYQHVSASLNSRIGTASSPVALQLAYNYTDDLFERYTDFDTSTHNIDFQARVGRSNVVFTPYFTGSLRSVETPGGLESGRESYDFLEEGVRGEDIFTPNLIHTYQFSHTSVDYQQLTGDNFEIWRLYQELDIKPACKTVASVYPSFFDNLSVFPWLELKQTAPSDASTVNEINGGVGTSFSIDSELAFQARVGWGDVQSDDPTIGNGTFSGWRYDTELDYDPFRNLHLKLSYDRVLSFTPTTIGRSVDVLDLVVETPFYLGAHFILIPAFEFYRTVSNDYQDPETAIFPQPSLQLSYEINQHIALYMKAQYRDTGDTQFGIDSHVRVLQTSAGLTATF